jgi:hypothetical protein
MPSALDVTSPTLIDASSFTRLTLPYQSLQAESFLSLAPDCQGGLILQKSFYADFVAPGAAVGGSFDANCTGIYAIGKIRFCPLGSHGERQQALQQRMRCIEQLYHVTSAAAPLQRASLMLSQLCDWVGIHEASEIPAEWVGKLAGVNAKTVRLAWGKYWQDCQLFVTAE